jgi:hypothetical protein
MNGGACPICAAAGSYCTLHDAMERIVAAQRAERVDQTLAELQRGWSIGERATAFGWIVSGTNNGHEIHATAATQWEAWAAAQDQAQAMPTVIVEGRL